MDKHSQPNLETDPRFPSGPWVGYYLQPAVPGRHEMEIAMTFRDGKISATGRDRVGAFTFDGIYQLDDGRCRWIKQYSGKHAVEYGGFNEGKGIWGIWLIEGENQKGGFHIWPEKSSESDGPALREALAEPVSHEIVVEEEELAPIGAR